MFIFDFDGVLMDSADEASVTAYNAATGAEARSPEEFPPGLAERFRRNRFHAQDASGMFSLMAGCLETGGADSGAPMTAAEYRRLLEGATLPAETRRERFFAARRRFQADDPIGWLELNRPYPGIREAVRRRGPERLVLLTSKNRDATLALCRHFGLDVRGENVFSGDGGAKKSDNLDRIHERYGRNRYVFIDDHLENLREVNVRARERGIALSPVLALWGYTGPDAAGAAEKSGFRTISREALIAALESGSETFDPAKT
jgi:phosphoglycolate phosphatase-like HAD superfamily hydrolase